jgi:hypothetical protein
MSEVTVIVAFIACVLATYGLVHACEWLRPKEHAKPSIHTTASKEARS